MNLKLKKKNVLLPLTLPMILLTSSFPLGTMGQLAVSDLLGQHVLSKRGGN
jgi:hypothetical protein